MFFPSKNNVTRVRRRNITQNKSTVKDYAIFLLLREAEFIVNVEENDFRNEEVRMLLTDLAC